MAFIVRYAKRIISIRVKDMPSDYPVGPFYGANWVDDMPSSAVAVAGDGEIDWPAIMQVAGREGISIFIFEANLHMPNRISPVRSTIIRIHSNSCPPTMCERVDEHRKLF